MRFFTLDSIEKGKWMKAIFMSNASALCVARLPTSLSHLLFVFRFVFLRCAVTETY